MNSWVRVEKKRVGVIILYLLVVVFWSSFVYAQWTSVVPPSGTAGWVLQAIHFTSPDEGWAVGLDGVNSQGVLLHYSEGSWSTVVPPTVSPNWSLYGVHFASPNEGWAVGQSYFLGHETGVLLHYSGGT